MLYFQRYKNYGGNVTFTAIKIHGSTKGSDIFQAIIKTLMDNGRF